jgi:transcription elongation factor GreA
MLRDAKVSEAPQSNGVVESGTVITAVVAGGEERFLLGSREIAGNTDLDVYSEGSPLGAAILGLKIGESTTYEAPNGKQITVSISAVETYTGS